MKASQSVDLVAFLEMEVYPRLSYQDVYTAPEHKWKESDDRARGGCPWHDSKSGSSFVVTLSTIQWYCPGCGVGGTPVQYLWKLRRGAGTTPRGRDWVEIARELANLARVDFPERTWTPEEAERAAKVEARRGALDTLYSVSQKRLQDPEGREALAYLEKRGFSPEAIRELGFGLYSKDATEEALTRGGHAPQIVEESAATWRGFDGYVVIPWRDARGAPLTAYGAWPGKPPEGKPHKVALPNPKDASGGAWEKTKRAPLYLDRALKAEERNLVLVEGVFDAALLQARGDPRVVACVAASFSREQVKTLKDYRVQSVTICLDPDKAGDTGVLSCLRQLGEVGISGYVAPRLPEGQDPDEYVNANGMEAWRAHIDRAVPGVLHRAELELHEVTPEVPHRRREVAVQRCADLLDGSSTKDLLHRDEVLRLVSERTGYAPEELSGLFSEVYESRERERQGASLARDLELARKDLESGKPLEHVASRLSQSCARISGGVSEDPLPFSVEALKEKTRNTPEGVSTGFKALDELGVEFRARELTVLGARTSHGKTSLLVQLGLNFLKDLQKRSRDGLVVFFSWEECEEQILWRLMANLSGCSVREVEAYCRGETDPDDLLEAEETLKALESRLQLVYRPSWTVTQAVAYAHRLSDTRGPIAGVFADYLQRIPPPSGSFDRRDLEVAAVARPLQELSVDLACPVVAGAQINREAAKGPSFSEGKTFNEALSELRKGKPRLHQLREGGSEQEVDLVLGLFNPAADYQHDGDGDVPSWTPFDVGILKARRGLVGRWTELWFHGASGRIQDHKEDPRGEDL